MASVVGSDISSSKVPFIGENATMHQASRPNREWLEAIRILSEEIDWESPEFIANESGKLEDVLRHLRHNMDAIEKRTVEIVENESLLQSYLIHCDYPRMFMDKFMLYMDPQDRFRIRLHRFKTKRRNGYATEKVHSHKWHMSTVILSGGYEEHIFSEPTQTDRSIKRVSSKTFVRGDVNSLGAGVPHQIINHSDDEYATSLFIRGPSLFNEARIFRDDLSDYYDSYSPKEEIRLALLSLGRGDPNFH